MQGDIISGVFADIEAKEQGIEEAERIQKIKLKHDGRMASADAEAMMGKVRKYEESPLDAAANVSDVKNYETKGEHF